MGHPLRVINPGERYGSMVVVNEQEKRIVTDRVRRAFLMKCDCGTLSVKSIHALRVLKSCSYTCPFRRHTGSKNKEIPGYVYTEAQLKAFASEWEYRDH